MRNCRSHYLGLFPSIMSTLLTFENLHFRLIMPHQLFLLDDLNEVADSQIIVATNAL